MPLSLLTYQLVLPSLIRCVINYHASLITHLHGILFITVYDVADRESFDHLPYWFNEITENADARAPVILVGNKKDVRCS